MSCKCVFEFDGSSENIFRARAGVRAELACAAQALSAANVRDHVRRGWKSEDGAIGSVMNEIMAEDVKRSPGYAGVMQSSPLGIEYDF